MDFFGFNNRPENGDMNPQLYSLSGANGGDFIPGNQQQPRHGSQTDFQIPNPGEYTSMDTDSSNSPRSNGTSSRVQDDDADIEAKRKAQNRAAQRAFRERKEQKVRELEEKLTAAEEKMHKLSSENERLKKENTVITTRNQVLLQQGAGGGNGLGGRQAPSNLKPSFPPKEFYSSLLESHDIGDQKQPSFIVYEEPNKGEKMLGAGAVWERIMEQELEDDIDLEFVIRSVRDKARCDGFGPVFPLKDVDEAIRMASKINMGL